MNEVINMEVNISEIQENDLYRVSRKNYHPDLPVSLQLSGMLEIPFIVKNSSGFIILTCHNRIKLLRGSGVRSLKCYVLDVPDARIFMNYVSLKSYRNELGPAGKLKSMHLLKNTFMINDAAVRDFCKKNLKLPDEVINNSRFSDSFFVTHDSLAEYLDGKDISFKIIRELITLPDEWLRIISHWTQEIQIRVNLFKMIVEYITDIYRRGDDISAVKSVESGDDKTLHDNVYRIRYPRYMKLKNKSDSIIRNLTGQGLSIDFPEYFDRSFITVKLNIDKRTDCISQLKKISELDPERLNELLSLL